VLELIAFKQLEGVVDLGHRSVEQRTVGQGDRAPAFGDYLMAPFFCSSLEPVAELRQGLEARLVGGPIGLIEAAPRGGEGAVGVRKRSGRRDARPPLRSQG
jgi:hypothetical protein